MLMCAPLSSVEVYLKLQAEGVLPSPSDVDRVLIVTLLASEV